MEALFAPAFEAWGSTVSWLELAAFVLSVAMVIGNQRQWIGAWPLAIAASALYGLFFWRGQLYGEAVLQLFFIALALWGWVQWARGRAGQALAVLRLGARGWASSLAALLLLAPLLGWGLDHYTASPLPYWDAVPTVGSVVATLLLGRKYIENWPLWMAVNALSVALFAQRGYWLTVLLYLLLIPLAAWGWRRWRQALPGAATA